METSGARILPQKLVLLAASFMGGKGGRGNLLDERICPSRQGCPCHDKDIQLCDKQIRACKNMLESIETTPPCSIVLLLTIIGTMYETTLVLINELSAHVIFTTINIYLIFCSHQYLSQIWKQEGDNIKTLQYLCQSYTFFFGFIYFESLFIYYFFLNVTYQTFIFG